MKKLTTLFACILFGLITTQTTFAQEAEAEYGEINIGAGLMYGFDIEQPGFRIDGTYRINEDFRATADLGLYLPDERTFSGFGGSTTVTSNFLEFNVNGNYIYYRDAEKGLIAYALAGIHFARVSVESGSNSNSDSEAGINLGTGGEYVLSFAKLFAEIKVDIGGFEQLNIGAGLRFPIGN